MTCNGSKSAGMPQLPSAFQGATKTIGLQKSSVASMQLRSYIVDNHAVICIISNNILWRKQKGKVLTHLPSCIRFLQFLIAKARELSKFSLGCLDFSLTMSLENIKVWVKEQSRDKDQWQGYQNCKKKNIVYLC